ncbi:hypothetical protein BT96DRAFT_1018741 [Gymnopus androsaceus JB14]|uniref:Uncharacterized protein n=1 Tax=Gymnopus androsaceus JB14 TaxID=1447944 RepID=A0A6A4HRF4_9AGAR|nr:hypothetical protein BT96DRAFT_1018741 [Gymnopus androsaceus JB14]
MDAETDNSGKIRTSFCVICKDTRHVCFWSQVHEVTTGSICWGCYGTQMKFEREDRLDEYIGMATEYMRIREIESKKRSA